MLKIALVAIAVVTLVPRASAALSDTEIEAGYCLGVVTAEIPPTDTLISSMQSSIESTKKIDAVLEGEITKTERQIESYDQVSRARALTSDERNFYTSLNEKLKSKRSILGSSRELLELDRKLLAWPAELRANKDRLYTYLVAKGLLFDPARAMDIIPLNGMTERGKADVAECGSSQRSPDFLSCLDRCGSDGVCVRACVPPICERLARCRTLNWLPL